MVLYEEAVVLRIGKLTDYALVVMAHVARRGHVCVHPAPEIALATGVPLPTVAKVLKVLSREGLVVSIRGARGGYGLGRDPQQISVVDVIEAMEGRIGLTDCSHGDVAACADEAHCQLAGHWPHINNAVRTALLGVSILDLARSTPRSVGRAPALFSVGGA